MTVPTQQLSFRADPIQPDPVVIRCKKCKVPLPDSTWKNCDRCRRNRTESFNRWKISSQARKSVLDDPGSTLSMPTTQSPSALSAPTSNPNPPSASQVTAPNPGPSTFSQAPSLSAPQQHYPSGRDHGRLPTGRSPAISDQPQTPTTPVVPQVIHVPEFQWSDELIDQLSSLPPRSRFVGKFSVIADPEVDNARRASMFADQLRARGVPISQDFSSSSRSVGSNAHGLAFSCTCQEACHGRLIVSVDDDVSHPYDVLGQRIGVAVFHPSG